MTKETVMPDAQGPLAVPSGDAVRPRKERWVTGRRARVLLCTSGASFMIMLDSNIVAVSLPAIARSLNAAFADTEWIVSAYVLTFAAFLMPAGALADRFGRRRLMISEAGCSACHGLHHLRRIRPPVLADVPRCGIARLI